LKSKSTFTGIIMCWYSSTQFRILCCNIIVSWLQSVFYERYLSLANMAFSR